MEKVGKDGVITVEEAQDASRRRSTWSRACSSTAATCRPTSCTDPERMEVVLEDAADPDPREEDLEPQGPAAGAREGGAERPAAADHRRGRRGRGARDARREQAARHAASVAAVKAPGFGDRRKAMLEDIAVADRRTRDHRGPRRSSSRTSSSRISAAPRRSTIDKDNTTIIEGAGATAGDRGPRQADPRADRGDRPRTTIARSCRSGSRSSSAASPSSRSARPPRPR